MTVKLTPKQEAFANKYVECNDATESYRFAYNCKVMSSKSINEEGCKLLSHPKIAPRIEELQSKIKEVAEKKFTISVEWRLEKLKEIIDAGISNYVDSNGQKRRENLSAAKGAIETLNSMLGTGGEDDDNGDPISITFNVSSPVKDVKVTRGE